jgi:hypothetical protein
MSRLIYIIFILGLILILLLAYYAFKRFSRGWNLKVLFKDFNRKIWMTVCLGGIFFFLYLLTVGLSFYFVHLWGIEIFFIAYHHPIELVYSGLCLFAFLSLSIYFARMLIKYLYLTRGKDS